MSNVRSHINETDCWFHRAILKKRSEHQVQVHWVHLFFCWMFFAIFGICFFKFCDIFISYKRFCKLHFKIFLTKINFHRELSGSFPGLLSASFWLNRRYKKVLCRVTVTSLKHMSLPRRAHNLVLVPHFAQWNCTYAACLYERSYGACGEVKAWRRYNRRGRWWTHFQTGPVTSPPYTLTPKGRQL